MPSPGSIPESLEAPLVIIGVGGSLAVVGTVPVVITLSLGINTSATIIGVGFIGFGVLIILPGVCWCMLSRLYRYRFWRRTVSRSGEQEEALVLSDLVTTGEYGGTEYHLQSQTTTDNAAAQPPRTTPSDVINSVL